MHNDRSKKLWRRQLPLIPGWGLTIHKCQGLTCSEGIVVDFNTGNPNRNVVGQPGMAFTALTRAEIWAKVAFRNMPPLLDFFAVRRSKMFKAREAFERQADDLHEATLHSLGYSVAQERADHVAHLQAVTSNTHDMQDMLAALAQRGVQPVDEAFLKKTCRDLHMKEGSSLDQVVRAFRGSRQTLATQGIRQKKSSQRLVHKSFLPKLTPSSSRLASSKKTSPAAAAAGRANLWRAFDVLSRQTTKRSHEPVKGQTPSASQNNRQKGQTPSTRLAGSKKTSPSAAPEVRANLWRERALTKSVLQEFGFQAAQIHLALQACGENTEQAIDFCLAHGPDTEPSVTIPNSKVDSDLQSLLSMGFDRKLCKEALRNTSNNLPLAVEYLLRGNIHAGDEEDDETDLMDYALRAAACVPRPHAYIVRDLGVEAGVRTNACLWLSVIDAWSQLSNNAAYVAHDPVLTEMVRSLPEVARTISNVRRSYDAVGVLADRLRQHFCAPNGVMHKPQMMQLLLPAFAALDTRRGSVATIESFKQWLTRVAAQEFADELVLLAIALHLRLWIVALPAKANWAVAEYPHQAKRTQFNITENRRILLGNNNLHYVHVL